MGRVKQQRSEAAARRELVKGLEVRASLARNRQRRARTGCDIRICGVVVGESQAGQQIIEGASAPLCLVPCCAQEGKAASTSCLVGGFDDALGGASALPGFAGTLRTHDFGRYCMVDSGRCAEAEARPSPLRKSAQRAAKRRWTFLPKRRKRMPWRSHPAVPSLGPGRGRLAALTSCHLSRNSSPALAARQKRAVAGAAAALGLGARRCWGTVAGGAV